jgi:hypothetical protein
MEEKAAVVESRERKFFEEVLRVIRHVRRAHARPSSKIAGLQADSADRQLGPCIEKGVQHVTPNPRRFGRGNLGRYDGVRF